MNFHTAMDRPESPHEYTQRGSAVKKIQKQCLRCYWPKPGTLRDIDEERAKISLSFKTSHPEYLYG
jgi:hypothetical protein